MARRQDNNTNGAGPVAQAIGNGIRVVGIGLAVWYVVLEDGDRWSVVFLCAGMMGLKTVMNALRNGANGR